MAGPAPVAPAAAVRDHLEDGGLAALPTESAWTLACLVASEDATARLRRQAPGHVAAGFASWLEASLFVEATPAAQQLAARLLPGPLGLLLEDAGAGLAHLAGDRGLCVRVPSHPTANLLLGELGPMAFGDLRVGGGAADVAAALGGLGCLVAEGDAGRSGATLVDARGERPRVVEHGALAPDAIEAAVRA